MHRVPRDSMCQMATSYRVLHDDDGPLGAAPCLVTEVQGAVVAATDPRCSPGDL